MEEDPEVPATSRQRIAEILRGGERSFEELKRELELPTRVLEEHLRHVDKSLKRGTERLRTDPACCLACGFVFEDRAPARFHAPGRCPRCRSERIAEPRFRIA